MRNPNGYGSVYKLKGRRRRPWIARVTTGWTTAIAQRGKYKGQEVERQTYQTVGYFETKQAAMDALALHRVDPIPPKADITLGELYEEWSGSKYKHISRSTKNNYKAAWKYIKRFEKAKFKEMRTAQWQSIIDRCDEDKLSQSTLKKIKTVAVMLSDHALQNDIINKNYAEFIEIPKAEKTKKDRFTDIEVKKIEDAADTVPWADTVLILIYTGMRISEMLQLTSFNVNLELQLITGGVKTDAGKDRIIPIHPKIQKYIKAWYDKGGDALITHKGGQAIRTKYYREKYYYPALKAIGVRKLTPHKCRHTFGSLMAEAGADTIYIQQIIGHTDYAFTANEYTHPEIEKLRQAISKI